MCVQDDCGCAQQCSVVSALFLGVRANSPEHLLFLFSFLLLNTSPFESSESSLSPNKNTFPKLVCT